MAMSWGRPTSWRASFPPLSSGIISMPDRQLRINTLSRYRGRPPRLVLEEHNHCEVPAGCGGVVLRWRNFSDGNARRVVAFRQRGTTNVLGWRGADYRTADHSLWRACAGHTPRGGRSRKACSCSPPSAAPSPASMGNNRPIRRNGFFRSPTGRGNTRRRFLPTIHGANSFRRFPVAANDRTAHGPAAGKGIHPATPLLDFGEAGSKATVLASRRRPFGLCLSHAARAGCPRTGPPPLRPPEVYTDGSGGSNECRRRSCTDAQ